MTDRERDTDRLPDPGDAQTRYRGRERGGGALAVTDERLLIGDAEGGDGEEGPVAVSLARVEEVTHQRVDWYLVLLGLAIVAFGLVSVPRNPAAGALFALAGLGSLLVTWRRRDRVRVRVRGRPKPLTLYPAEPGRFLSAVGAALDAARVGEE
ncbi:hypothetical protein [Haloparvum sedimenti]|uniref:hypothetical protein n=1 Tax=Haloparvum sedimenti TaxID=1678448 RepID=UPI00071E7767|nr:hypothetical protein [Haloparvum sedimenti]